MKTEYVMIEALNRDIFLRKIQKIKDIRKIVNEQFSMSRSYAVTHYTMLFEVETDE